MYYTGTFFFILDATNTYIKLMPTFYRISRLILVLFFIYACNKEEENTLFVLKKADQTHIQFQNLITSTPELNILTYLYYYNGAGVASGDFNNDGYEDLYFAANQGENKLYLNKGNLEFKELSSEIVADTQGWTTGVTTVDINNDGLLDLYVCKVGGYLGLQGGNKLFINQGIDNRGIPRFKEQAAAYNLAIVSFSTQASFFDYDLDGDLDMYLLNHSVHPNQNYGRGSQRKQIDELSGDRLYRNDDGYYTDVSSIAGIYQGAIGYGLGLATSDVNNDGYPDIYIGNDFFENDYLYINQQNGTFREVIASGKKKIHTSHFSMGVDIADINNDAMTDILSLDMLSEDLETYRSSGSEHSFTIYNQYLKNGYQPQYMQNTLQLNRGNTDFSEIAFFSGIAATDWSWAPQIADYDNDGFKDIFVSNGILGATNDMDFINFIANDKIQQRIRRGMQKEDLALIDDLPTKKMENYFYRNKGDLTFENVSNRWATPIPSYSNGAIYVDLDNDGDLDIVVNNCNEKAFVYENQARKKLENTNYIKLKLKGASKNRQAIGAKATVFTKEGKQISEVFTTKGYLSAVSPVLHFGLGKVSAIDSIQIQWPDKKIATYEAPKINTTLQLNKEDKSTFSTIEVISTSSKKDSLEIYFRHQEYETKDFNFETLTPYASSNEGPHITVRDINNDGLDDVFIPGGRYQASVLLMQQTNGIFRESNQPEFEIEKRPENIDACFFDADTDGDLDMVVVSGGNEKIPNTSGKPVLFLNKKGSFQKQPKAFPEIEMNASTVITADIDQDGDQDVLITSSGTPQTYGEIPTNYILKNTGTGNFIDVTDTIAPELRKIGQVYDAQFVDFNKDNHPDLIVAGHYMPITVFMNDGKGNLTKEKNESLQDTNGWWNCILVFDADKDGDMDIVAGNWGLNSRLKASKQYPIQLYRSDFDKNGRVDPIVTYFYDEKETPIANTDELTKQLPILNKQYTSYGDFAKADFQDYFTKTAINAAEKRQVFRLETTYFKNNGNTNFTAYSLPWQAQISSVHDILIDDINEDGYPDMILGGNTYELNTQLSRLDASYGVMLLNDKKGNFREYRKPGFKVKGAVRSIESIKVKDNTYFLFGVNNDSLQIVKK